MVNVDPGALHRLIAEELGQPVSRGVLGLCERIKKSRNGVLAVLFYGAGLWETTSSDTVLDFYVLIENYRRFDSRLAHAVLGRLLPPNVYYLEHGDLRCKFAVIRIDQFKNAAAGRSLNTQIWARFAQPCRLVYARDRSIRDIVVAALVDCVATFHAQTLPLLTSNERHPKGIWTRGFSQTYDNEWRSEDGNRAGDIYAASRDSLNARSELVLPGCRPAAHVATRGIRRKLCKSIYFIQLMKAVFTFEGGVDYALWKIERQSGVKLCASGFQRRHPLISAWPLVWKAWRLGALR